MSASARSAPMSASARSAPEDPSPSKELGPGLLQALGRVQFHSLAESHEAALKIQRRYRGFAARKWTSALRNGSSIEGELSRASWRPAAASTAADGPRRVALDVAPTVRREMEDHNAAVAIQCRWRGSRTRRRIKEEVQNVADRSAKVVQAHYRRRLRNRSSAAAGTADAAPSNSAA
mmetsp:Transcript_35962/g.92625  ORF Transcript_35962/g.92625 Transcript_35962/m.92625 type:complete len:177 (-) Transcript_35962:82-612(-)